MFKEKFNLKEMIYISLLAATATVTKTPIRALSTFLTSSVGLPAGVVGGVYYMFWIVAACAIVKKRGTATLFCIIQIFVSIATSSMPIIKLITYLPPGIAIDVFLIIFNIKNYDKRLLMLLGGIANGAGAVSMAFIMGLPFIAVVTSLLIAIISGSVGGYLAYLIVVRIEHAAKITTN